MALRERLQQVAGLERWELRGAQEAQKQRYDAMVKPQVFEQKVLLLLPSSADKLLMKW